MIAFDKRLSPNLDWEPDLEVFRGVNLSFRDQCRKGLLGLGVVLLAGVLVQAWASEAAKSSASSSSASKTAAPKSTTKSTKTSARTSSKKKKSRKRASWRRGQQKMDAQRAREIQDALIREHYLDGKASGIWDNASQKAMERYQGDNGWQTKTIPDSRALIKLGLGPDHEHLLNPESAMTMVPVSSPAKETGNPPKN